MLPACNGNFALTPFAIKIKIKSFNVSKGMINNLVNINNLVVVWGTSILLENNLNVNVTLHIDK